MCRGFLKSWTRRAFRLKTSGDLAGGLCLPEMWKYLNCKSWRGRRDSNPPPLKLRRDLAEACCLPLAGRHAKADPRPPA